MMPPHLRPTLVRLEVALRGAFGERLSDVRLFGSYARGEANEDSDVDVLVLIDELQLDEIARVADLTSSLALETGVALAPLPMASERFHAMRAQGRPLAEEIAREGERH